MKLRLKIWLIALGLVIPALAYASVQGDLLRWGIYTDGKNITVPSGNLTVTTGNVTVTTGNVTVTTGTLSVASGVTITTGGLTVTAGAYVRPISSVSVTSPTKTVDVADRGDIKLTTDVAQTGFTLSGGTIGQEVTIYGTSDTNTSRWDDNGSTLSLGSSNITLGIGDSLTLQCTATKQWTRKASADN